MVLPPLETGAVKLTAACILPAVAKTLVGALAMLSFPAIFVQITPLKTWGSPEVPQSKHHICNPTAGDKIAFFCTSVILGGKKPCVVLVRSSKAEEAGVVVPSPT